MSTFTVLKETINRISEKEKRGKFNLWVSFTINFVFFGFTPKQFCALEIYKKTSKEKKEYVNFFRSNKLNKKLNDKRYQERLTNKVLFNSLYSGFINREWIELTPTNYQSAEELLEKKNTLIAKPFHLSGGRGIHLINNSRQISKIINEHYILEEVVKNHERIGAFSDCLNTVRIYTLLKDDGVLILSSCLRIGAPNSITDNMHTGGHCVSIDWETGFINSTGKTYTGIEYNKNPLTGEEYIGIQIPNWDLLKNAVINICKVTPQCKYCAWDFAITNHGVEVIEGNVDPDPTLLQLVSGPCFLKF